MKKLLSICCVFAVLLISASCAAESANSRKTEETTAQTETKSENTTAPQNTTNTESTVKKSTKTDSQNETREKETESPISAAEKPAFAANSETSQKPTTAPKRETSPKTESETNPKTEHKKKAEKSTVPWDKDLSCKSNYAKIRCPEVPYYGYTDPLCVLTDKDLKKAQKLDSNEKSSGDLQYRDFENGVEITSSFESGNIPEEIKGKPVLKLGGHLECEEPIDGYTAPDTYYESFWDSCVRTINIPSGVRDIVFNTFEGLHWLEKINVSPDNPYYSSVDGILYNKDKTVLLMIPLNHKREAINIPDTVHTAYSFFSNNAVTVNIPASVKKLSSKLNVRGEYKNSVYNLEELSIESQLKEINVDEANLSYSSSDGILYNKNQTKLLAYPRCHLKKTLKIPDSVREIDSIYLDFHENLKTIVFGKNIKKIGFCSEPAMAGYSNRLTVKGYKNTPIRRWINSLGCWDNNVKFIALD